MRWRFDPAPSPSWRSVPPSAYRLRVALSSAKAEHRALNEFELLRARTRGHFKSAAQEVTDDERASPSGEQTC